MRPPVPSRCAGFTLIEMLAALSIAGVLSGIAYPSFLGSIQKARRADALIALVQVQVAQERWRFNHASYGDLSEIGVNASPGDGHYRLEMVSADADGYLVRAVAQGGQARDRSCRVLALHSDGAAAVRRSGTDDQADNPPAANRRCWGQ